MPGHEPLSGREPLAAHSRSHGARGTGTSTGTRGRGGLVTCRQQRRQAAGGQVRHPHLGSRPGGALRRGQGPGSLLLEGAETPQAGVFLKAGAESRCLWSSLSRTPSEAAEGRRAGVRLGGAQGLPSAGRPQAQRAEEGPVSTATVIAILTRPSRMLTRSSCHSSVSEESAAPELNKDAFLKVLFFKYYRKGSS